MFSNYIKRQQVKYVEKASKPYVLENLNPISFELYQHEQLVLIKKLFIDLNKMNAPFFLHSGALLGWARSKKMLPWDDDIDLGIDYKYFVKNKQKLFDIFSKHNFIFKDDFETENNKIDTFRLWFPNQYLVEDNNKLVLIRPKIDIMFSVDESFYLNSGNKFIEKLERNNFYFKLKTNLFPRRYKKKVVNTLRKYLLWDNKSEKSRLIYLWTFRKDRFSNNMSKSIFESFEVNIPSNWEDVLVTSFGIDWKTNIVRKDQSISWGYKVLFESCNCKSSNENIINSFKPVDSNMIGTFYDKTIKGEYIKYEK